MRMAFAPSHWRKALFKKSIFLFLLLTSLCSCQSHWQRLSVLSEYLVPQRLASYHASTPDPRWLCPPRGQRLSVQWYLYREWTCYEDFSLHIWIQFRNHELVEFKVPIENYIGRYEYDLLGEDYCEKGGLLAFKVDLMADGEVLEHWQHILWVDLIEFNKEEVDDVD